MSAGDAAIFDIVERWARLEPDRRALEFGDRSWTYAQLADRIRRAATMLRGAGIGPGDHIAVLDRNHPACLELTFAASLIGATNAVLNSRLAPEQLVDVLNDAGAQIVATGEEFVDTLDDLIDEVPSIRDVVVFDDDYESRLAAADPFSGRYESTSDDHVLRLYASGPNGEMLTQAGMLAHAEVAPAGNGAAVANVVQPLADLSGVGLALGGLRAGVRTVVIRDPVSQ